MTDGGKYVVETGEGYQGTYAVAEDTDGLRCQIGKSVLRDLGAHAGDEVCLYNAEAGVVLATARLPDRELLTSLSVTPTGQLSLSGWVLSGHVGVTGADDRVRLYDHRLGVDLVSANRDPRVGEGP